MYRGSQVDVYTRMKNLTSELKARTVKLHPRINSLTALGSYDTLSEIGKRKRRICLPRSGIQIAFNYTAYVLRNRSLTGKAGH